MWAQDRVPLIEGAVATAAPGANVTWESDQSFNFTSKLEAPGWAGRFDVIVMGDIGIGQLTPRAQANLVQFVRGGGGLVYDVWEKSTLGFQGTPDANPMPLAPILPYQYPDQGTPRADAQKFGSGSDFFKGLDFSTVTAKGAADTLDHLLMERPEGKGHVLALYGAFGPTFERVAYATYKKADGGWDSWPRLGDLWARVLSEAAQNSPVRSLSQVQVSGQVADQPLHATIAVDGTKVIDKIRAADFSIVALEQLYNEDGGQGEDLFLALNPRDWFDRRTQEVLANTKGVKADKPAFLRDYNIKGIYMADDSYGSYGQWDDAKYASQAAAAIAAYKANPDILAYFQAGNEPPLDAGYVTFHKRFVGSVLQGAPGFKVVGPNKAFNLLGVDPVAMRLYIDQCGATTDVLNWHTYAQPPSMTLAEARYWSDYANGKMRSPGPAPVMFTESDAWNQGDSQFNYLMNRAFTFLPEPRIIASFQYCMRPRTEGGTYKFGVLQPDGDMEANYNGYWIWRNLRGDMTATTVAGAGDGHVHAISSRSQDGKTFTTVVFYDSGYYDGPAGKMASQAMGDVNPKLPPGTYTLEISDAKWNVRTTRDAPATGPVHLTLAPYEAVALTWTRN